MQYVIQGKYDSYHGWEDLTVCESKEEATAELKTYRENEPEYLHRMRPYKD
jgi:hypothetical protein